MSALPAETTELSPVPLAARPAPAGAKLRAERRAEQAMARRSRRMWGTLSLVFVALVFFLTVGILEALR